MKYYIYHIKSNDGDQSDFFMTKSGKAQALQSIKRTKCESIVKSIILNNNFTIKLLSEYDDISKNEAAKYLQEWRENYNDIEAINKQIFIKKHTNKKDSQLNYGLNNETILMNKLNGNNTFNMQLKKTLYRGSQFDFVGQYYFFELKSLTYSFDKYNFAVMNTSKLNIYKNLVFIFEYTETTGIKRLFYHIYNKDKPYNKRNIHLFDRGIDSEVINIEKKDLFEFSETDNILLPEIKDEFDRGAFRYLLTFDQYNYANNKERF
jgi:hypothetical protein